RGPLFAVSSGSSEARAITALDKPRGDISHLFPQFLPDGRLLYFVQRAGKGGIYIGRIGSSDAQFVVPSASAVRYASPGYLLFGQMDPLMAQRFDVGKGQILGEAAPIAEQVGPGPVPKFSVSDTGVLAFAGPVVNNAQLAWYGRDGKRLGSLGEP